MLNSRDWKSIAVGTVEVTDRFSDTAAACNRIPAAKRPNCALPNRLERPMRYFFNQIDGEYKLDDEGLEFASLQDARLEAVRYAGEVMRDHPTLIWKGEDFRVEVTDERHLVLFTVMVVGVDAPAGGKSSNPALEPPA